MKIKQIKIGNFKFNNNLDQVGLNYLFSQNQNMMAIHKQYLYFGFFMALMDHNLSHYRQTISIKKLQKLITMESLLEDSTVFNLKLVNLLSEEKPKNDLDVEIFHKLQKNKTEKFMANWQTFNEIISKVLNLYMEQPEIKKVLDSEKEKNLINKNLNKNNKKNKNKL